MVVFEQMGSIRAKWFCSGNVVVVGQKLFFLTQYGSNWAKIVVLWQIGCFWAKVVVFGQSCCIRAKVVVF